MDFDYRGKKYPARITMGAHLIYREQTGEDFTKAATRGAVGGIEVATLMWASVRAACRADGVEFTASFEEFCDHVTPDEASEWYARAEEQRAAEAKKKIAAMKATAKK